MISSFPIHPGVSTVLALTAVLLGLLALAWEPARALVRSPAPMVRRSAPDGKQRAPLQLKLAGLGGGQPEPQEGDQNFDGRVAF